MSQNDPVGTQVPLSDLPSEVKATRSGSFGTVASEYERFRPGPPPEAADWLLPDHVARVVDLGAGTGALTRLLVGRADEVVAVEPDDRMRGVLERQVPEARAVSGRGESIPLPDGCVQAVLASSSWHWMDPLPTLLEVGRVLVPGGVLGALWSGPDPESPFMSQAQAVLTARRQQEGQAGEGRDGLPAGELTDLMMTDALRPVSTLRIVPETPFDDPEHRIFRWDVALDADELIGLLATLSWVITLPEQRRAALFAEARRLLSEVMGIEGEVTVDVTFRADVWRARRRD